MVVRVQCSFMTTQVWVIRNRQTGKHWQSSSGRGSWCKSGHAKMAWSNKHKSTLQDDHIWYEVVDLMAVIEELESLAQAT